MEENNESKVYSKVPAKITMWTSFKNFWLQPITLELTPSQKKVFTEVHNFWNQEVYINKGVLHLRKGEDQLTQEAEAQSAAQAQSDDEPEVKISL